MEKAETVVVTGGTAGVGSATVREFAANGANVAILARDKERLETAKKEVEELGAKAIAISVDVAAATMAGVGFMLAGRRERSSAKQP